MDNWAEMSWAELSVVDNMMLWWFDYQTNNAEYIVYWYDRKSHQCSQKLICHIETGWMEYNRTSRSYEKEVDVFFKYWNYHLQFLRVGVMRCCWAQKNLIWYGIIWYDMMDQSTIWYHIIWHYIISYDIILYNMTWYNMTWYNMTWSNMTWYNMKMV